MLIQIHILQNYAPSNLNRDENGSPKDTMFGGYRRGRISSQCLKRSIRQSESFKNAFSSDGFLGVRTKTLPALVGGELEAMGINAEDRSNILSRLSEIGRESSKKKPKDKDQDDNAEVPKVESATKQLIFMGKDEIHQLSEKLVILYRNSEKENWRNPKKLLIEDITKSLGSSIPRSVDIAMFGRMTTSALFTDVQASVQVAHAISANKVNQENDYFTAIDDLKPDEVPGADMIGDVEFNSSTYYKYINVFWDGLISNLGGREHKDVAVNAATALLEVAVIAQPTGKQNTFAAQNLPDLVLVEVFDKNIPVSYANAFLKPVDRSGDKSLMDNAVEKLDEYAIRIQKTFNLEPKRAFFSTQGYILSGAKDCGSLASLITWLQEQCAG